MRAVHLMIALSLVGCGAAAVGNVRSPTPSDQPLVGDVVPDQSAADPGAAPGPAADPSAAAEPNVAELASAAPAVAPVDETANCKPARPYGVSCNVFGLCGSPAGNTAVGPLARPTGADPRCDNTLSMLQH